MDLDEFVTKADINSSLSAFFKCNFVSVREAENVFVWSEKLDFS
jgi:hypothetical protein